METKMTSRAKIRALDSRQWAQHMPRAGAMGKSQEDAAGAQRGLGEVMCERGCEKQVPWGLLVLGRD